MKTRTKMKLIEAVKFDDSLYVRTHGTKPKGRGSWAFAVNPNDNPKDFFFSSDTTFANAKKDAISFFKGPRYNNRRIYIMP